jgi:pSer/pThr/pTyr-binding forkhead associated (FHA) protein
MYSDEIVITIYDAYDGERRYVFHGHERCIIGRAEDCDIRLPSDDEHMGISRHHCVLEIDPPRAFISDLGSMNGTFVNGVKIGPPRKVFDQTRRPELVKATADDKTELKDGDQVHLGRTALWASVEVHADDLQTV